MYIMYIRRLRDQWSNGSRISGPWMWKQRQLRNGRL
ncbi:hypothetical protein HNQ92_002939 [Rhabdobacter roseus]|uniref:Uncharacterized protein n=1 Tax=Rhabdobacter roseus TaxID=1655419 RepID=A0A840TMF7_9BACT|nr:hypothetical protein [Rhabdobacter roseus]